MTDWKKWHIEVDKAIEKPTQGQLIDMDKVHYSLYTLSKKIAVAKEELAELEDQFKDLKDSLNPNNLPNWAWNWIKKQGRVAWKQIVIDRLGQTYVNKISAKQKQKEYPQIGIQFIDPVPDKIPIDPIKKKSLLKPKRLKLTTQQETLRLKYKLG